MTAVILRNLQVDPQFMQNWQMCDESKIKMVLNILQHIRGLNDFLIWHEIAEIDVFPKVQQGVK